MVVFWRSRISACQSCRRADGDLAETELAIEGAVPGDLPEGGQRHTAEGAGFGFLQAAGGRGGRPGPGGHGGAGRRAGRGRGPRPGPSRGQSPQARHGRRRRPRSARRRSHGAGDPRESAESARPAGQSRSGRCPGRATPRRDQCSEVPRFRSHGGPHAILRGGFGDQSRHGEASLSRVFFGQYLSQIGTHRMNSL